MLRESLTHCVSVWKCTFLGQCVLIRADYCLIGSLNDILGNEETHLWASDQRTVGIKERKMGSVITEDGRLVYFMTVNG